MEIDSQLFHFQLLPAKSLQIAAEGIQMYITATSFSNFAFFPVKADLRYQSTKKLLQNLL